ncbi:ATP-binding response regulator [Taklimakanibacter deserti]|uniref:ATP-binding response regulator n=1 Tax=Taklimakanibacter deserti TaxID=2267839 RepID=UPI000E65A766
MNKREAPQSSRAPPAPSAPRQDTVFAGLDAVASGIAVWDAAQKLRYCNRHFRESFHHAIAEIAQGLSYPYYLELVARSNELVLADPAGWIAEQESRFGSDGLEEQPLADGRIYQIQRRATEDGGMVTTVYDISLLKRGEKALVRAKELAETADQTKSRFLRAANHDLRQPLATLKILIYNCMSEPDEEHRNDLFHAMDIAVSIMEDLLGALLQIGQLDAGKIVPRVTTFQLAQIFQRLDIQFRHQAQEKGLKLRIVDSRSSITSDKALLERILSNLVANAVRYTDVGRILIGCRHSGGKLRIEVRDTGRGIGPQYLERIFDEFYQVADGKRDKKRGLGLGLNIVKRIAGLLDHPISVRSTQGKGSLFAIEVPAGNVWHSDIGEPEISESIGGEFAGVSVLLIEDDEALRIATTELLERWGIVVHAIQEEAQARELFERSAFDPKLIIADYSLREQHGTEVVRSICALLGREIPSIIVTADTDPLLIQRLKGEGFPVLIKPVNPPRLRVLMHNLLYEPQAAPVVRS